MKPKTKRLARWILGSVIGLFALTAFAHTKVGLEMIAFATGSSGCPFGGAQPAMTVAAADRLRIDAIRTRATEAAPSRPALGFELDTMRRSDVMAWTLAHTLGCRADRSGAGLTCRDIDGGTLPSPIAGVTGVLAFGFDADDRLVSVSFQTASTTQKTRVLEVAGEAMARLEQLGARSTGDPLDARSFVRRETRAAFTDYAATVVASNAGKRWVSMQLFQSIPKPARG